MTLSYKLVAIDLDGTLLGSDHAVSSANAEAVRQAVQQGMTVVLASGRQWATIDVFAGQLGLPSASPIIAYNGAMIRTHGGETWYHQPMPADASQTIVHFCLAHGYHLNLYFDDRLYVQQDTSQGQIYQQRTGTIPHVTDLAQFDGKQPTKLLLIDTAKTTNHLLAHFQGIFGNSLYITKTEDEYLEFMDPRINKGVALAEVARRLDFAASECVAFGDAPNDLPMLQWAGLSFAMENARSEIKAMADRIAPSADADGVARMLMELLGQTT